MFIQCNMFLTSLGTVLYLHLFLILCMLHKMLKMPIIFHGTYALIPKNNDLIQIMKTSQELGISEFECTCTWLYLDMTGRLYSTICLGITCTLYCITYLVGVPFLLNIIVGMYMVLVVSQ